MVDKGEACVIEIESEYIIVLVESEIKHKILHKNIEKRQLEAVFPSICNSIYWYDSTKKCLVVHFFCV